MAYLRGSVYIWSSGTNLHLWTEAPFDDSRLPEGYGSGVEIPEPLADQFAVMRFAELLKLGKLNDAIDQALAQENFGADALAKLEPLLRQLSRPSQGGSAG